MSILDNLPHRCTISRIQRTVDDELGTIDTPKTIKTDVPCWQQQASSSETQEFEKRGIADVQKIYFIEDPEVTEQHEIMVTERMGKNGLKQVTSDRYEVISTPRPDASAGLDVVYRVMVKFITGRGQ